MTETRPADLSTLRGRRFLCASILMFLGPLGIHCSENPSPIASVHPTNEDGSRERGSLPQDPSPPSASSAQHSGAQEAGAPLSLGIRYRRLVDELLGFVGIARHEKLLWELQALAKQDPELANTVFLEVHHENPYVADNLLDVLDLTKSKAVHPSLLISLDNSTAFVRVKAAQSLARNPTPAATEPLGRNLLSEDAAPAEREAVLEALRRLPSPESCRSVLLLLDRELELETRIRAVSVVGDLGDKSAEKHLRAALSSGERALILEAAKSLLKLGFRDPLAIVRDHLKSKDRDTVQHALQVVQELGLVELLPEVGALSESQNSNDRLFSVAVLATLDDSRTLPFLEARLEDPEELVRRATLLSLAEKGNEKSLEALRNLASGSSSDTRWARMALARVGDAPSITEMIRTLQTTKDLEEARSLIRTLSRTGDPRVVQPLLDLVCSQATEGSGPNPLAGEAARYLANLRETILEPLETRYRNNERPEVRILLVTSLNFLGSPAALETLRTLESESRDPEVLSAIRKQRAAISPSVRTHE